MKIEFTDNGWKEVVPNEVIISRKMPRSFGPIPIKEWISTNERLGLKDRKTCNCCKTNWKNLEGGVNFYFSNKENKAVCDSCSNKIDIILSQRNKHRELTKEEVDKLLGGKWTN
jgi:hypothetical protein